MLESKTSAQWRSLRVGTSPIYIDYELGPFTNLVATNIQVKIGTPIVIKFDLGGKLRTRNPGNDVYGDAKDLADGEIDGLTCLEWSGRHGLAILSKRLRNVDVMTTPWRLVVKLVNRLNSWCA